MRANSVMRMVSVVLFLGCLGSSVQVPSEQANVVEFGSIQGKVIDTDGHPVPDARIMAEPMESSALGKLHYVLTNADGEFLLEDVAPGLNVVSASKEEDGYPNTLYLAFVSDPAELPKVAVLAGHVTRGVIIRLGPKGGKLTGKILDSRTGEAVLTARILLTRDDDSRLFVSTGPDMEGRFEFVLPSRPFRFEVSAPGYTTWKYRGVILLKPQGRQDLSIQLQTAPVS